MYCTNTPQDEATRGSQASRPSVIYPETLCQKMRGLLSRFQPLREYITPLRTFLSSSHSFRAQTSALLARSNLLVHVFFLLSSFRFSTRVASFNSSFLFLEHCQFHLTAWVIFFCVQTPACLRPSVGPNQIADFMSNICVSSYEDRQRCLKYTVNDPHASIRRYFIRFFLRFASR
jgi:hypothetical protein